MEKRVSIYFLVCKSLSIDDVGVTRDAVHQDIRSGAGFKTGDFVEEKFGGATVERLQWRKTKLLTGCTIPRPR